MRVVGAHGHFEYGPAAGDAGCFYADCYHASVAPTSEREHLKIAFFFRVSEKEQRFHEQQVYKRTLVRVGDRRQQDVDLVAKNIVVLEALSELMPLLQTPHGSAGRRARQRSATQHAGPRLHAPACKSRQLHLPPVAGGFFARARRRGPISISFSLSGSAVAC